MLNYLGNNVINLSIQSDKKLKFDWLSLGSSKTQLDPKKLILNKVNIKFVQILENCSYKKFHKEFLCTNFNKGESQFSKKQQRTILYST